MIRNAVLILVFLGMLPLLLSCGTYIARYEGPKAEFPMYKYYPATHFDSLMLYRALCSIEEPELYRIGYAVFGLTDLPFSLVVDTILLPYDIWSYPPFQKDDSSGVIHSVGALSNASLARPTFSMISSAGLRQTKGFG